MSNELRDPHDPVIPGEHVPSPEGHGGVSMPIGQSNPGFDTHEPVLPEGMHGSESYEAMQRRVEGELQTRAAYQHVEDHPEYGPDGKVVPPPIDPIAQHVAQAQIAIDQQKAALPSSADLDAVEAEKALATQTQAEPTEADVEDVETARELARINLGIPNADSTAKAEGAKGRVSKRS